MNVSLLLLEWQVKLLRGFQKGVRISALSWLEKNI